MYLVHAGRLVFETDDNAQSVKWYAEGLDTHSPRNSDFFRVHLDDGMQRDLTVRSSKQWGTIHGRDNDLVICYDTLLAEDGKRYDIELKIHMRTVENTMEYYAEVKNHDTIRVNEIQCPFVELSVISSLDRAKDILYCPYGVGERIPDPWTYVSNCHTEYMTADYQNVWYTRTYPFPLSMAWMGIESGSQFLYLARYDEQFRTCSFSLGGAPRGCEPEMIFSISHYPIAVHEEHIICGKGIISLMDGMWQDGADLYRKWADSWYRPLQPVTWVKNLTGWQRVILKHQYGEIFFTYPELVKIYEDGAKYGLDTLLVFGWWKGRFDNGYPQYEPDAALGGAKALKEAIQKIQSLGGHVILYNNGVLIDVSTDYYEKEGHRYTKKNIDGVEYREFYQFANNGMMLRTFGYKSFSSACHGTEGWKEKLLENARIKLSFHPDSLFFDQLGGHLPRFCFDTTHKHKNRCDMDVVYKMENTSAVRKLLGENQCIGTENVVDVLSPCFDYSHGCEMAWYSPTSFPSLYRHTFPETVITNRLIHDNKPDFRRHLNFAFVNGLRFDVSIYRGRKLALADLPDYAQYVRYLLELKEDYRSFFYDGTFIGEDRSFEKKFTTTANLFAAPDDRRLLVVWNDSDQVEQVMAYHRAFTLKPNEFVIRVLDEVL